MVRSATTALLMIFGLAGCAYTGGTPDYIPFGQDLPGYRASHYIGGGYATYARRSPFYTNAYFDDPYYCPPLYLGRGAASPGYRYGYSTGYPYGLGYSLGYGSISKDKLEKRQRKQERKLQKRAFKQERKLQKRAFKQDRKLAKQQRKQQRKANKRSRKEAKRARKYQ